MKTKDYIEKHKEILGPIHEIPVKIAVLGIMESIAEEYGGDFYDKIIVLIKQERDSLMDKEITETTDSGGDNE